MTKENFFVFLDVDGVLWDIKYLKNKSNDKDKKEVFNPKSIDALNYLIEKLELFYNVNIVISSFWRYTLLNRLIKILKRENLNYDKEFLATEKTYYFNSRGKEISKFLKDKVNNDNFVIIDNRNFDFDKYFDKKNIIKTNVKNMSLNKNLVDKFLDLYLKIKNDDNIK